MPPATAHAALFAAAVLFDDHRDVDPRHRPDVGQADAFGAQDLHLLQARADGGRHLHDTGVKGAGKGVDLAQHLDLHGKGGIRHRVGVGIEPRVGALWGVGQSAAAIAHRQSRRFRRAAQCPFRQFGGMGIARNLALHRAQTKAFGGIVAGVLDAAIVQNDGFGPPAFQKQLAIIGPGGRCAQNLQGCGFVQMRLERAERGIGHLGHP